MRKQQTISLPPIKTYTVWRILCCVFLGWLLLDLGLIPSVDANIVFTGGRRKVWSDTPDWESGSYANRITWSKVPGQIQLDLSTTSKIYSTPYLYIPNSASNTLVQLDTKTGKMQWNLSLQSVALDGDPSRTTVDVNGNVWVGLRRSNKVILVSKEGKILLEIATGGIPRAITIDLQGNLWVGNWADNTVMKLDGSSGQILQTLKVPCAYGATTDIHGNIWIVNRCRQMTLTKISQDGKVLGIFPATNGYGIASDQKGQIWLANYLEGCVYRFSNDGKNLGCIPLGYQCINARGVAVDGNDAVWVACSNTPLVVKLDNNGKVLGANTSVGNECVGLAVDADGYLWAISRLDNTAAKIDTKTLRTVASYSTQGIGPYTYSDMTGFQFQRIARSTYGEWRGIHNSSCVARWSRIHWSSKLPHGTSIIVRARTAATQAALAKALWSKPVNRGEKPEVPDNPWIEIEVALRTFDNTVTPIITDLTVEYETTGQETCNGMDDDCDGILDNIPGTKQPLIKVCQSKCGRGVEVCSTGQWRPCNAPQEQDEVCNGIDDNCDGRIDENAKCAENLVCAGGLCVPTCDSPCPSGTSCTTIEDHQVCVGEGNCQSLQESCQKQGKVCRHGQCVDPCAGVLCATGLFCVQGRCEKTSCFEPRYACLSGQICKEGQCVPDPCQKAQCTSEQVCKQGTCVASCAGIKCSVGKSCREGKCTDDPCADVLCAAGGVCAYGRCYRDPCQETTCPGGQICVLGKCIADPCIGVTCPTQQTCHPPYGDCYASPSGQSATDEYDVPADGSPWSPPVFDGGFPPQQSTIDSENQESDPYWPPSTTDSPPQPKTGCHCQRRSLEGPVPALLAVLLLLLLIHLVSQRELP